MERVKFPAGPEEWKKSERNDKTIALNVLYMQHNTKTISVAYRSEYKNNRRKQVILLMITNSKKYHYLAVTYPYFFKEIHQIMKEIFII